MPEKQRKANLLVLLIWPELCCDPGNLLQLFGSLRLNNLVPRGIRWKIITQIFALPVSLAPFYAAFSEFLALP
jgi:hypothetical protein